ncbi:uncharacterized protein I206_102002 [Kwoniella pini CBS 10737]|uniref:Uncharacterized protein n=1 Tax=Kwoniella pini CBS 10737 TaxID=1296096 RepID=A0A1B9HV28_9TREE|nr:uncharacterized protein I206_06905 [Kwoniella pini CBS 10737]OCF47127.1 hypothetical protein I206_06905 [Kwoniella pini CBS 10737]
MSDPIIMTPRSRKSQKSTSRKNRNITPPSGDSDADASDHTAHAGKKSNLKMMYMDESENEENGKRLSATSTLSSRTISFGQAV